MIISFITPAYNASETIGQTLASLFRPQLPQDWQLDVIVVDDGSRDAKALSEAVSPFDRVRLIKCEENQGKIAAMNRAVPETVGDIVIVMDADDTLLHSWPERLSCILQDWPKNAPLCFSACEKEDGTTTVADPEYAGPLSLDDIINERHMGEYLPIFWGDVIRNEGGYRDPGRGVCCELWTYLTYAQRADLWVSPITLRVYNDQVPGSLSAGVFNATGAARMVDCYDYVFADFEDVYRKHSPRNLGRRKMRQAVFAAIAGQRGKAWQLWRSGARLSAPLETVGALILIALGAKAIRALVSMAKKTGLLRQYG